MMDSIQIIPLFVIIALAGAFIISLIGKKLSWIVDILGNLTTLILLVLSILTIYMVNNTSGTMVYTVGGWQIPFGISLVLDGFTSFMLVTVNLVAFCTTLYSINYMERFTSKWQFYTLFLLMLAGMNG
ncbi:MAG: hypothetical protein ABII23_05205, partial [bacterium]